MRSDVYDETLLNQDKTQVLFLKWVNILELFVDWLSFLCTEEDMFQLSLLLILLLVDNIAI